MELIDTHAHLCDPKFDLDREAVVQRTFENGVGALIEIAESPDNWGKAKSFSSTSFINRNSSSPSIYWACGFHPHYAERFWEFDFDIMKSALSSPHCVALGEVGLDYAKSTASREQQIELFKKTLEIAVEFSKPVIIHCRDAQADTARILKSFYGGTSRRDACAGVVHCFSGDQSFAEIVMDLGFYVGVDGPVTYPSAKALREVLAQIPLEKIVLETDSPYLPPEGFRGKRNESSYLGLIALKISEMFEKNLEEVSKITTENARKLFRLWNEPK